MTSDLKLTGGQVLDPSGEFQSVSLFTTDGKIADKCSKDAVTVDCSGCHILPGIIDAHGDAFELELHPRPGVDIAFPIAMTSVDKQLISNGITTAYHGLTVSWEPGARSLETARHFMRELPKHRQRLMADHRVQLRWEVFAHDAFDDLDAWLQTTPKPTLAFNDHTTESIKVLAAGHHEKLEKWAKRVGVSLDVYLGEFEKIRHRETAVASMIKKVAALADRHAAIMLAHDENTIEDRKYHRTLGMKISEFPMSSQTAQAATDHNEHVIMGGPNVLRGGSHKGFMSAEQAIRDNQCNVIASDYYYPSLLHSAEHLVNAQALTLPQAWNLISQNPADAMQLYDRGRLQAGKVADIVVIDCSGPWTLKHTISRGALTSFGS